MTRTELLAILPVCLLYMVRMLGLFMVIPVLPLLASGMEGATPLLIGFALGIYGLSQAGLQIPLGLLSDRIGRKPVILGGLLVFVLGGVVAATSETIWGVVLGRFLQGMGAIASTLMAMVGDLTRVENRTTAMMMIGLTIGASFFISLIVGPWLGSAHGLEAIFWVNSVLGVVGILVLWWLVPEVGSRALPDSRLLSEKLGSLIKHPHLLRLNTGIFVLHYLLMSGFMAFPLYMQATGQIADNAHYQVYLVVLTSSALLMGPLMWVADRRHLTRWVLSVMVLLFILSFLLLAVSTGLKMVVIALFLFFMAFNLLEVNLPAQVSRLSPAGTRGTAMGIYSTSQFAGAFVGGSVGGWILQYWDMSALMYVNAGICVCWLVLFLTMRTPRDLAGKTVFLHQHDQRSAIELIDALLSIAGVEDVVVLSEKRKDNARIVYLKVDKDEFEDDMLAGLGIEKIV